MSVQKYLDSASETLSRAHAHRLAYCGRNLRGNLPFHDAFKFIKCGRAVARLGSLDHVTDPVTRQLDPVTTVSREFGG